LAFQVFLKFPSDTGYQEITQYCRETVNIEDTLFDPSTLKYKRSHYQFEMVYEPTLIYKLINASSADLIDCYIMKDGARAFTGFVDPILQASFSTNKQDTYSIDVIDNSVLLDKKLGSEVEILSGWLYNPSDPTKSILTQLLTKALRTITVTAPTMVGTWGTSYGPSNVWVPYFIATSDDNLLDTIRDLVFSQCYGFRFDANGNLALTPLANVGAPTVQVNDSNKSIIDGTFTQSKPTITADSLKVTYYTTSSLTSLGLAGGNTSYRSGSQIPHKWYMADGWSRPGDFPSLGSTRTHHYKITLQETVNGSKIVKYSDLNIHFFGSHYYEYQHTSGNFGYRYFAYEYLPAASTTSVLTDAYFLDYNTAYELYQTGNQNLTSGPTVQNFTLTGNIVEFDLTLPAFDKTASQDYRVFGVGCSFTGLIFNTDSSKSFSIPGVRGEYQEFELPFCGSAEQAQNMANWYKAHVIDKPFTFKFDSYNAYPVGSVARINLVSKGLDVNGIISSRVYDYDQRRYSYAVKQVSSVSFVNPPAAIAAPVKAPSTTFDDINKVIDISTGQLTTAITANALPSVVGAVITQGMYLGNDRFGYFDGTDWPIAINSDGTAQFKGKVTASEGSIGSWVIGQNSLSTNANMYPDNGAGTLYSKNDWTDYSDWTAIGCTVGFNNGNTSYLRVTSTSTDPRLEKNFGTSLHGETVYIRMRKASGTFTTLDTVMYLLDTAQAHPLASSGWAPSWQTTLANAPLGQWVTLSAVLPTTYTDMTKLRFDVSGSTDAVYDIDFVYVGDGTYLYKKTVGLVSDYSSDIAIYAGSATPSSAPFRVNYDGSFNSTSGAVGGWTIGPAGIWGSNLVLDSSVGKIYTGSGATHVAMQSGVGIWAGDGSFGTAPFRVTPAGALVASNANITGAITATSGTFTGTVNATAGVLGGWLISGNTLESSGAGTARIKLDKSNSRITVLNPSDEVVTAQGFLSGLQINGTPWDASRAYAVGEYVNLGNVVYKCTTANTGLTPPNTSYWAVSSDTWATGNYGFWSKLGTNLVIDGNVSVSGGDWLIAKDSSYLIKDGTTVRARLGSIGGISGLYLNEANWGNGTPTGLTGRLTTTDLFFGNSLQYIKWSSAAGLEISGNFKATSGYFAGFKSTLALSSSYTIAAGTTKSAAYAAILSYLNYSGGTVACQGTVSTGTLTSLHWTGTILTLRGSMGDWDQWSAAATGTIPSAVTFDWISKQTFTQGDLLPTTNGWIRLGNNLQRFYYVYATNVDATNLYLNGSLVDLSTMLAGSKITVISTSNTNNTVTPSVLHTFTIPAGKTLRLDSLITFQTATTTTGGCFGVRVTVPSGGTGTVYGTWQGNVAIVNTTAANRYLFNAGQFMVAAGANAYGEVVGTGVTAGLSNHDAYLQANITNSYSATVTVTIEFRSEVAGSAVTIQPGTITTGVWL